ncbi:hypothetical protein MY10362_004591 [Beauveria mimosiformis]
MKLHSSTYIGAIFAALLQSRLASAAFDTSNSTMLLLSNDSTFNFDLLTALGESITGGGDVGPILGAAKEIEAGNMTSIVDVFYMCHAPTHPMMGARHQRAHDTSTHTRVVMS